jgi:hypothetical protein
MVRLAIPGLVVGGCGAAALAVGCGSSSSRAACAVTLPATKSVASFGPRGFNYGTTRLRAQLWKGGKLVAGILPGGGAMAIVNEDGSIDAKQGWWRGVPGTLAITGHRLDRPGRPLRASVPGGYGATGFNPAGLTFPSTGCWKVTGRVGSVRLSYVVKVTKLGA